MSKSKHTAFPLFHQDDETNEGALDNRPPTQNVPRSKSEGKATTSIFLREMS